MGHSTSRANAPLARARVSATRSGPSTNLVPCRGLIWESTRGRCALLISHSDYRKDDGLWELWKRGSDVRVFEGSCGRRSVRPQVRQLPLGRYCAAIEVNSVRTEHEYCANRGLR
jgi:hypothetical protein